MERSGIRFPLHFASIQRCKMLPHRQKLVDGDESELDRTSAPIEVDAQNHSIL
jgi:hypothetical protein